MFFWRDKEDQWIIKFALSQQSRMESERAPFEPMFSAAIRLFQPRRYDLSQNQSLSAASLRDIAYGVRIYDSHPARSLNKFGTAMAGNMVSREDNDPFWIQFTAPDQKLMEIDVIKDKLQEAQDQVRFGFNQSTFYAELPQFIQDAGVTYGVMTGKRDPRKDRIVYQTRHPKTYWFHTNDLGDIDADHFKITMTAYDLVKEFGDNPKFPQSIRDDHDGIKGVKDAEPFKTFQVLHVIYRNQSRRSTDSLDPSDKEYIQFYIVMNVGKTGNAAENAVIINRYGPDQVAGTDWRPITLCLGKVPGMAYPLSLALDGLTSATYNNELMEHQLVQSSYAADPLLLAHDNLKTQIRDSQLNPGSKIYTEDLNKGMEYIVNTSQVMVAKMKTEELHEAIEDVFFLPFFNMLNGAIRKGAPQMTAFQVSQMVQEKIPELTPIMESAEDKILEPASAIEWIYETEKGRMPDMPEELFQGSGTIQNKYMGRFAQLKRSLREASGSIAQIQVLQSVQAIYPNALRIVRSDKWLERILLAHGMEQSDIFDEQDIIEMDRIAAEEEAQQQQLAIAGEAAKLLPPGKAIEENSPVALAGA